MEAQMTESTVWWLLAGSAVVAELLTGTFYLLMLATGLVAAAIAAHLGATITVEMVVAAIVGGGSVLAWRSYKQKTPTALPAGANHDVNMDVGETVHVEEWGPQGTGEVKYRGAIWQVSLMPGASPVPGPHVIVEVVGSRLVVRKL
jgi:membrane protein implicated in regulation of membrane protease activity